MTARFRCAVAAADAHEPRYATASTVRRWLLIEQPGPWGVDAVRESRMAPATAEALVALGSRLPVRVLLIRRPGGREPSRGRAVYVAFTGVRTRWLEAFTVDDPADVLGLDLSGLRRGAGVGGRREDDSLLLVCTNGRHDACCAEFGRPAADALAGVFGDRVWEVSHIGGDRFAGNLVALPDGLYFGGLDADAAVATAGTLRGGHIDLGTYRGRSALPFPVQAAEYFLRRERGWLAVDAVRWTDRQRLADDRWSATFATPEGAVTVEVAVERATVARQLTCRSPEPVRAPRYQLIGMRAA